MREKDVSRFAPAIDEDRVVIEKDLDLSDRPRWEALETNYFHMRRRLLALFLKTCNMLITRMRAGKRLNKIKGRFQSENIKTKEDVKRMVAEDWKTA